MAKNFKPGNKVKMIGCLEAEKHRDKIWTVKSEQWNLCGSKVVLLQGRAGGFATEFLELVANR